MAIQILSQSQSHAYSKAPRVAVALRMRRVLTEKRRKRTDKLPCRKEIYTIVYAFFWVAVIEPTSNASLLYAYSRKSQRSLPSLAAPARRRSACLMSDAALKAFVWPLKTGVFLLLNNQLVDHASKYWLPANNKTVRKWYAVNHNKVRGKQYDLITSPILIHGILAVWLKLAFIIRNELPGTRTNSSNNDNFGLPEPCRRWQTYMRADFPVNQAITVV